MSHKIESLFSLKIGNEIISITSIIPEYRLINGGNNDILFQSNIKKLLNQRIGNHISQSFGARFVIVTRLVISFYKSKERFFVLSKPINIILISQIKAIKRFFFKGLHKYHLFVIELEESKTGINILL